MALTQSSAHKIQRLIFFLICAAVCIGLLVVFIQVSEVNNLYRARFGDMVDGTAYRPYVYRTLLPTTVRLLAGLLPDAWNAELASLPWIAAGLTTFKVEPQRALQALIAWGLMGLSLLGFALAFRRLLTALYRLPDWLADLGTLLALAVLPVFWKFGYIYDFTTLFLFTLQLLWMAQGRWRAYLALFPFTCLNKETAVLLPLLFAVYYFPRARMERGRYVRLLAAQAIFFVSIKLALNWVFAANPGAEAEVHWQDHVMVVTLFPVVVAAYTLLVGGLVGALVGVGWRAKPLFLRWGLIILAPLFATYFVYGFPFEFRAMYEAYPILAALAVPTLARLLRRRVNAAPEEVPGGS